MDNEKQMILREFIKLYRAANDKEAFISMWEDFVNAPDPAPLTIADAYDNAYGSALIQVYASEG